MKKQIALWFILCGIAAQARSQVQTYNATPTHIRIGEQITLKIELSEVKSAHPPTALFEMPDTLGHFLIIKKSAIDTLQAASSVSYAQTLTITSFDSGYWPIENIYTRFPDDVVIAAAPLYIAVQSVDVSNLKDFHDIKAIEEVFISNNRMAVLVLLLLALASLAYMLFYKAPNSKKALLQLFVTAPSYYHQAFERLEKLKKMDVRTREEASLFYVELVQVIRNLFFHINLIKSSNVSTKILHDTLKQIPIPSELNLQFIAILALSNGAKFAKFIPPYSQNQAAIESIRLLITALEQHFQTTDKPTPKP